MGLKAEDRLWSIDWYEDDVRVSTWSNYTFTEALMVVARSPRRGLIVLCPWAEVAS